jgi:uncharacterized membrane protein (DUF2068 family)
MTADKHFSRERDAGVFLIALFKLAKGVLLLAVALGAATLLHKDVAAVVNHWANTLWIARENRWVHEILYKLAAIDDQKLKIAEAATLIYSALLLTEGVGLLFKQRWAEYLTVIITASYIPFEIFASARRPAVSKSIVLVINIAVVWYLCRKLRRGRKQK